MDLRRLRAGEWITGLGGVVLLLSLFLPWYTDMSAWDAMAAIDVVLALVALAAIALVPVTAAQRVPAVPLAMDALIALAAKVALILVLIRLIQLPDGADTRELGIWLALLGSAVVLVGAWVAMRDERLSTPGKPTDLTGVPAPAPEIETLPAPRPQAPAS